jgi:WD40 repeat protein/serine/threonine protein kinase
MGALKLDEAEIFNVARHIQDPEARRRYVRQACGEDLALAERVEALLRAHDEGSTFLASPTKALGDFLGAFSEPPTLAPAPAPGGDGPPPPPPAPAGYEILGELGRGGMGVVYQARQAGLNRLVALKMILAGSHAGPEDLARFRTEAEAVAALQHPNIVQIHEVGERDGLPYFSLELVEGGSLADRLNGTPWGSRPAAELVAALARAMDYAHRRGVIHRDLKPANVLLSRSASVSDASQKRGAGRFCEASLTDDNALHGAVPKITDFGLAKQLDSAVDRTRTGAVMGTPSYMAPEQAGGKSKEIGPACDTYALGAILYELLTGRPPFRAETPLDTMLQVVGTEPVPPRRLAPKLPRDLETICLKCLEKGPARRYASAGALADDLQRFLDNQPIQARPTPAWERLAKWARRRPAVAALLIVSVLAAASLIAGSLWYSARLKGALEGTRRQRDQADRQRRLAQEREREARRQRRRAEERERTTQRHLYDFHWSAARQAWQEGRVDTALALLQTMRPGRAGAPELRSFEWHYLTALCQPAKRTVRVHTKYVTAVAISPRGQRVASVDVAGVARIWNAATGQVLVTLPTQPFPLIAVAFSRDGRYLATGGVSPSTVELTRIWDAATGEEVAVCRGHQIGVLAAAFSPNGRQLATAGADGKVKLWDAATGRVRRTLAGHSGAVHGVAFSPSGKVLATAGQDCTIRLWNPETGEELRKLSGHTELIRDVTFNHDGSRLATASFDKTVRIWETATGRQLRKLRGHTGWLASVSFDATGRHVASSGGDFTVRIWNTETGEEVRRIRAGVNGINLVRYSPDGTWLAAACSDAAVRLFEPAQASDHRRLSGHKGSAKSVALGPGGHLLASSGEDGTIKLWDADRGRLLRTLQGHQGTVRQVAFRPDGKRLASAGDDHTIKLWDVASGRKVRTIKIAPAHLGSGTGARLHRGGIAFSRDGKRLASAGRDGTVRLWNPQNGHELRVLRGHKGPVNRVVFRPDGKTLLSAGDDAVVRLWDVASGRVVRSFKGHVPSIWGLASSSDGRRIASGSLDGSVRIWEAATGRELFQLRAKGIVTSVAFSPDNRRVVAGHGTPTSGQTGQVTLWDAVTGQELLDLPGVVGIPQSVAFSSDGHRLAAGCDNGRLLLWDAPRPDSVATRSWKTLFTDDFGRAKLGKRWAPGRGSWSVKGGALRGRLKKTRFRRTEFAAATAALTGIEVPQTAEIRFDCRADDDLNIEVQLTDAGGEVGLGVHLMAVPQFVGTRGALIYWQSSRSGPWLPLVTNSRFEFKSGKRYRVRIVRLPNRVRVFVDDALILSGPVSPAITPRLHLGGMMSKKGAAISFANLTIRAPAAAIRQRQLRSRVERLWADLQVKDLVRKRLRADTTLTPKERASALTMLAGCQESRQKLLDLGWNVVKSGRQSAAAYRLALHRLAAAHRLRPKESKPLTALGVAQYRVGQYRAALATLTEANDFLVSQLGTSHPTNRAFTAMTLHQLGRRKEALAVLADGRDLLRGSPWLYQRGIEEIYDEAVKTLGPPAATAAEKEAEAIKQLVTRANTRGWFGHDLAAYLAVRSADLRAVVGRGPKPDRHDLVMDRKQHDAMRRLQFLSSETDGIRFRARYQNLRVRIEKSSATLTGRFVGQWATGFGIWEVSYRLRHTPRGWKIALERGWPVKRREGERVTVYDADYWMLWDVLVALIRRFGDGKLLAQALDAAHRPTEAHAAARRLTQRQGATAADWVLRGNLAVQAGDATDALRSYRTALTLDPEIRVPAPLNGEVRALRGHQGQVYGASLNPDTTRAVSSGDDAVRLWDLRSGKELRVLRAHADGISAVAFSPNGKRIASGGGDNLVKIWNAATGKLLHTLRGHTKALSRVAFSKDGRRLV